MKTPAEVLTEARALIAKGWCQGSYYDTGGRCCAMGAIYVANHQSGLKRHEVVCFLEDALDGWFVTHWNDVNGRTQAEVLAAFDKAIELARGES